MGEDGAYRTAHRDAVSLFVCILNLVSALEDLERIVGGGFGTVGHVLGVPNRNN